MLFEKYIIVPFGLLKKGRGKGFERHLPFQIQFSSLISLCKDFFKTSCGDGETLCVHYKKFVVYTCKCANTSFGGTNHYCFTCLVLHVHCESFFTKLSDANLLYLCDVHVSLIVHLGLFLMLVYGDVVDKPFVLKSFLYDVVCNTYVDTECDMNIPKPVPNNFYHDMVSYLYEHATRCIYPRTRVRISLSNFYRCFVTLNDVYPDCVPKTARSMNKHVDMFTRLEYFIISIEIAKSCVSTCRICTKSVRNFITLLNIAM